MPSNPWHCVGWHRLCVNLSMGFSHFASFALLAAFPAVLLASQPSAHGAVTIPEPTDLLLFSMGVAGLLIGRRAALKRGDKDGEE